ncbi:translation protein [Microthyrium microscopicum]|uniref:Large ribosomal subunit protein uL3m n=1 Tax=Microthyrium microscopicum TaxID=703497 RepID=A0A6A6UPE6_9PEZI|nr:translation protein [Microthyrium microscopicum]
MPPRVRLRWHSPQTSAIPTQSHHLLPHRTQIRTIRSIREVVKPSPKPFEKYNKAITPYALSCTAALARKETATPHRPGVLARKKGMSSIFNPSTGKLQPVTILQLDRCQVTGHKRAGPHGYWAVQVGYGWRDPRKLTKAMLGHFGEVGVAPKQELAEFRVRNSKGLVPVGTELHPSYFQIGQFVDTRSQTKGKGFAGGMKRHGWKGQPASHGQSLTHRTMGSSGGGQGSGSRVHPGKNMPGRMGGQRHTIQNLKVMKVDDENGILVVMGHVSGPNDCFVQVQDAKKKWNQFEEKNLPIMPPTPAHITPDSQALEQAAV